MMLRMLPMSVKLFIHIIKASAAELISFPEPPPEVDLFIREHCKDRLDDAM
jgi:hypothetical protein